MNKWLYMLRYVLQFMFSSMCIFFVLPIADKYKDGLSLSPKVCSVMFSGYFLWISAQPNLYLL
jgi:hypothetical protein